MSTSCRSINSKHVWMVVFLVLCLTFSRPAFASRLFLPGHLPAIAQESTPTGLLAQDRQVSLVLCLPLRNTEQLSELLQKLYDPSDPRFGKYLSPEEFTANFGPTEEQYRKAMSFAQSAGFKIIGTHPNRTLLDVAGPVSAVDRAFSVHLTHYRTPTGRLFFAPDTEPTVPAESQICGIIGLDDAARWHPESIVHVIGDSGSVRRQETSHEIGTGAGGGLDPSDIGAAYNLSDTSANGAGQNLAIMTLDGYTASDITAYENQCGLPDVPLKNILVDGATGKPGAAAGETTLDIEMQSALASGASTICVYESVNGGAGILDAYNRIVTDDMAAQISTSWGAPESELSSAAREAENQVFKQMAAQGQSFFAAAGDNGAYDDGTTLSVDDPASQPYVCGVGGTTLATVSPGGAWQSETTWNSGSISGGAGGGGVSTAWPIPAYQKAAIQTGSGASATNRNVPDVSLNTDPNSGYSVWFQGGWYLYGGTSCAAPLWAAFTALVNQVRSESHLASLGFPNPTLYTLASRVGYASDFHDIADGSNNLYYLAVPGYDDATGLGSFNGGNLLVDLSGGGEAKVAAATLTTFPAGLQFFSVPEDYSGVAPWQVLSTSGIEVAIWDTSAGQYVLSPQSPADVLRPGTAYWGLFPASAALYDTGAPVATTAPFSISLTAGWNMIGDPFESGIDWSGLSFTDAAGHTYSETEAVQGGHIQPDLFTYDSATHAYVETLLSNSGQMNPYLGYWLYADENGSLSIPPPGA